MSISSTGDRPAALNKGKVSFKIRPLVSAMVSFWFMAFPAVRSTGLATYVCAQGLQFLLDTLVTPINVINPVDPSLPFCHQSRDDETR